MLKLELRGGQGAAAAQIQISRVSRRKLTPLTISAYLLVHHIPVYLHLGLGWGD